MRSVITQLLLVCFLATSCERSVQPNNLDVVPTPTTAASVIDSELETNRRLWAKSGIRDYDMAIDGDFGNGIGGPANNIRISVRNNSSISIVSRRTVDTRPTTAYKDVETVEKMFLYIEDLRKQTRNSQDIDATGQRYPVVRVQYNKKWGYPSLISILPTLAVDAGVVFTVKKLSPVSK